MRFDTRQVNEKVVYQGRNEQIAYALTTTPWGSSPTDLSVSLYSIADGPVYTDVSDTNLSGSPSANGDIITTSTVTGLDSGTFYRLEIRFTCSGNVFEAWLEIRGQQ